MYMIISYIYFCVLLFREGKISSIIFIIFFFIKKVLLNNLFADNLSIEAFNQLSALPQYSI